MNWENPQRADIYIRKNNLESYDSWLHSIFGTPTYDQVFYSPVSINVYSTGGPQSPQDYPDELLNINLMFSEIETVVKREIYDVLGLIGDLGGVSDIFVLLLGLFIFPISEFSYNLKALQKLYLVSTKDPNIVNI
jgi:hypothetical protein